MYKLTGIIFVLLLLSASPAFAQDLKVDKSDSPDPVKVDETLSYTIKVTNESATFGATAVKITDTLPDDVQVIGYTFSDPGGSCTLNDRKLECTLTNLTAKDDTDTDDETTVRVNVEPTETGSITNKVEASATINAATQTDKDSVDTQVEARGNSKAGNSGGHRGRIGNPRDRNGDGFISQAEEALNAAEDLNSVDESTDGENTTSSLDASDSGTDGDVSANGDENGAEASTPGAVASANGDEDTLGPVSGPQGDVVNDIPESGPLPNTGGISLLALAMPVLGVMLLGVALVANWGRK